MSMSSALIATAAVMLDWLLGEPRRWHPLVGFGRLAAWIESRFYGPPNLSPLIRKGRGAAAVGLLLIPPTAATVCLTALPAARPMLAVGLLYLTLGHRSLHDHAKAVVTALRTSDATEARRHAARLVSRDPETLKPAAATTESVLENGSDAVFASLFWFFVAGAPGAVLHRLANTLDAMWGYRSARYHDFGWAAARLDDLLNYLPARLTALTYTLLGNTRTALACWRRQAPQWDSPNAGPVMAAGAGALEVRLGGPARYRGRWHRRPVLGCGEPPDGHTIEQALRLLARGVVLWLSLALAVEAMLDA